MLGWEGILPKTASPPHRISLCYVLNSILPKGRQKDTVTKVSSSQFFAVMFNIGFS